MRNFIVLLSAVTALLITACGPEAITTKHGFRFINHTNKGGQKPKPGDWVLVQTYAHIKDSLMLDTRRDYGAPQESELFPEDSIKGDINGMYDAIFLMSVGDSATVYQPLDSADMQYVPEGLKDAKEVAYTMVLLKITSKEEKEKAMAEEEAAKQLVQKKAMEALQGVDQKIKTVISDYTAGKINGKLKSTPSGVKILVEENGSGSKIGANAQVNLDYYGCLRNGEMFDNSYMRGQPLSFTTAQQQMIPGFDEAVQQLNHGAKAYIFIPPNLAYGDKENGPIPANSELIFYIEIL